MSHRTSEDKESFAKVENDKALSNFDTFLISRDKDSVSFGANQILMNLITVSVIPSEWSAIIIESATLVFYIPNGNNHNSSWLSSILNILGCDWLLVCSLGFFLQNCSYG